MADRGVSTALNYVLALAVVALLVSGLFVGMSGFAEERRDGAVRTELSVVGNRLATELGTAERLALTGDARTVRVGVALPARVSGTDYAVAISRTAPEQYVLVLRAPAADVSATVRLRSRVRVRPTTVGGGDLRVVYDGATDRLEVTDG
ncbi:hypothetical protein ACFQL1_08555 [Halomicroarcula sp. GCM10025709]|uniref:DUF7266 family protein n=1 Tax=Haloarcula TaxID=2237 RepID=UPI0024C3EFAE|nr:hypothetical protein [Halomicroarcula sp. YJ-61-S]